jgi:hypothetical protein
MSIKSKHLDHVMRTLGASILNLEFPSHNGDVSELASGFTWAGLVQISGAFTGGFAIRCGTQAASVLSQGLLQEKGQISDELIEATLMELAYLVAGSLSPLLEGEITLAPARSMQGASVARMGATSKVEVRAIYEVAGEAVEVALFRS